jgi:hypothetical protein
MSFSRTRLCLIVYVLLLSINQCLFGQTKIFDYSRYLFGTPSTLSLSVQSVNASTGSVSVNGGDSQAPTTPFTWNWGDGNITNGFFPQSHAYASVAKNYILTVIAHYSGGKQDSAKTAIRFVAPNVIPITLPSDISVRIPSSPVTLGTRLYTPPVLSTFDDRFFVTLPRSTLEYILSIVSSIEKDFSNNDVFLFNSKFEQVMLRDSSFGGAYSLWFTNPVAFGVGDVFLKGSIGYAALFHEMGHNYTLNTPGHYYFGGRIDGNANAIYSESMAQIYSFAAGYELINHYQTYGLSDDLMWDIEQDFISSISGTRSTYDSYVSSGKKFSSWNDPITPADETFNTFGTIAYEFCKQAENWGQGYRAPLKRMVNLLEGFNPTWWQRYDQSHNTAAADTFRATLMAAAVSYGFAKDLRADFRNLNFPISDQIYNDLYNNTVTTVKDELRGAPSAFQLIQNYPNPFNPSTTICYQLPQASPVSLRVFNTLGEEVGTLVSNFQNAGFYQLQWTPQLPIGVYIYQIRAGSYIQSRKMIILK